MTSCTRNSAPWETAFGSPARCGGALVVSFHGYDFSAWPRQAGRDAYVRLFATADAVTVNSRHTWDRLADSGCPPERLHLLPVGVDLDATPFQERGRAPDGEVRALTVARLVEKKGIAYAIRAVAQARAAYPELVYHIAGDGPLRAELETLARDLGVAEQVIFTARRIARRSAILERRAPLYPLQRDGGQWRPGRPGAGAAGGAGGRAAGAGDRP